MNPNLANWLIVGGALAVFGSAALGLVSLVVGVVTMH